MFKGLKNKLAEETKKIQDAVVTQVGEGFTNLARRSDASSTTSIASSSPSSKPEINSMTSGDEGTLLDVGLNDFEDWSNSNHNYKDNSPALELMENDQQTPTISSSLRQRHDSASSIGSSVDNFFPNIGASPRMATIPSDVETDVESVVGSTYSNSGATKEQISAVLHKLQGRAANYKEKYRQLASAYKALANENDKIRVVLTASQDKALRRIQELKEEARMTTKSKREIEENFRSKILSQDGEVVQLKHQLQLALEGKQVDEKVLSDLKINVVPNSNGATSNASDIGSNQDKDKIRKLEDLLNRCKESIKGYKEKMQQLTTDNQTLNNKLREMENEERGSSGMSQFAMERTVNEYKQKIADLETVFEEKQKQESENNALLLAQFKQEMHAEIEKKDRLIEDLRQVVNKAEASYQEKLASLTNELQRKSSMEQSLEQEKKDLVHELSQTKQAAIKIVREEEEAKRKKLQEDLERALLDQALEFETKFDKIKQEYDGQLEKMNGEYEKMLKEREEQMQLALEERDLQKMAALAQHDQKNDMLQAEIEALSTEKLQITSMFDKAKEQNNLLKKRIAEEEQLELQYESQVSKLRVQIDDLTSKLAQKEESARHGEKDSSDQLEVRQLTSNYDAIVSDLRAANSEASEKLADSSRTIDHLKNLVDEKEENLKNLQFQIRDTGQKKLNVLRTENEELWSQVESLRLALNEKGNAVELLDTADLKRQVDGLSVDCDKLSSLIVQKDTIIQQLNCDISEKITVIENLTHQLNSVPSLKSSQVAELETVKLLSSESSAAAASELSLLRQECAEKDASVEDLNCRHEEELANQRTEFSKIIDALKVAKENDSEKFHLLRQESGVLKENNEQLLARMSLASEKNAKEVSALQQSLEFLAKQAENLKADLNGASKELTDKDQTIEEKNHQIDILNGQLKHIKELYQDNESLKEKLGILERNNVDLENRLNMVNGQLEKMSQLEDQIRSLSDNNAKLAEKANTAATSLKNREEECDSLKKVLEMSDQSLRDNDEEIQVSKVQIVTLKEELAIARRELDQLSHAGQLEMDDRQKIVDDLSQRLASVQDESSRKMQALSDQVRQLSQTNESLTTDLSLKDTLLEKLTHDKSALDDKQTLLKRKYDSILKDLKSDLNARTNECKTAKENADKLQRENDDLTKKVELILDELETLKVSLADSTTQIGQLTGRLSDNDDELARLRLSTSDVEEKDRNLIVLDQKVQSFEETVKSLQSQLTREREESERLSNETKLLKDRNDQLTTDVSSLQERLASTQQLEAEIASLVQRSDESRSQMESLEHQLIEKQIAIDELQNEKLSLEDKQTVLMRKSENALKTLQQDNKKLTESLNEFQQQQQPQKSKNSGIASGGNSREDDFTCIQIPKFMTVSLDHSNVVFSEPTEAEYLRNIVFRYMVERETLGKESINLAKAIAAVLKLDLNQTREILEKEEARLHSWIKL